MLVKMLKAQTETSTTNLRIEEVEKSSEVGVPVQNQRNLP
jgi:hypothetical protein